MRSISLLFLVMAGSLLSCIRDVTNEIGCSVEAQTATLDSCAIYIPNIITPNDDGVNDVFQFFSACDFEQYRLTITNGSSTVYESTDPNMPWDGRQSLFNTEVVNGVFAYEMLFRNGNDSIKVSGTVTTAPYDPVGGEVSFAITNCSSCTFPDQIDPRNGVVNDTRDDLDRICQD